MCAKNRVNIFGSFLDIRQNADQVASFFGPPGRQSKYQTNLIDRG